MSEVNEKEHSGEVQNKVNISPEDCDAVKKYCSHFGVPGSLDLDKAVEAFKAAPTFENQQNIKLEVCKWIIEGNHESFKDSLWDAPKKAAEEVVYDLQFDKDLKEELILPAKSE